MRAQIPARFCKCVRAKTAFDAIIYSSRGKLERKCINHVDTFLLSFSLTRREPNPWQSDVHMGFQLPPLRSWLSLRRRVLRLSGAKAGGTLASVRVS